MIDSSLPAQPKLSPYKSCLCKNFPLLLALALSALTAAASVTAAPLRDEVLTTWTTEQGLPQNFITSLAQTPDGFVWVGTMNGLVRFDGLHFRGFSQEDRKSVV